MIEFWKISVTFSISLNQERFGNGTEQYRTLLSTTGSEGRHNKTNISITFGYGYKFAAMQFTLLLGGR